MICVIVQRDVRITRAPLVKRNAKRRQPDILTLCWEDRSAHPYAARHGESCTSTLYSSVHAPKHSPRDLRELRKRPNDDFGACNGPSRQPADKTDPILSSSSRKGKGKNERGTNRSPSLSCSQEAFRFSLFVFHLPDLSDK